MKPKSLPVSVEIACTNIFNEKDLLFHVPFHKHLYHLVEDCIVPKKKENYHSFYCLTQAPIIFRV